MAKMTFFSTYLKEIVYGGNDGIVTTFAIVAGFAGAQSQATTIPLLSVLLFGFANLFADGVSMALGNFLSSHSEKDVYAQQKREELDQMQSDPTGEEAETRTILKQKGFTSDQAEALLSIYKTNRPYWLAFMMNNELEMANPEKENALMMSLTTFFAFVLFGLIPLLPYVLFREHPSVFPFSLLATATALLTLGVLRWRVTRQRLLRSLSETLFLGGLAAMIAYGVGTLFRI